MKKIIDLILYSNLWIALCATAMAFQTQYLLVQQLRWTPLLTLITAATLFLYAIHRIVGIAKVKAFWDMERYAVIAQFKTHISIYAFLAAVIGAISFFYLKTIIQISLIIPGIISLAYVLPFLKGKKRLRDFNDIKIFLIAIVWSWITVILVSMDYAAYEDQRIWILALEKAFFIFAITLPFDIRDLQVDAHSQVKTIPARLGIAKTNTLMLTLLAIVSLLVLLNYSLGLYSVGATVAMQISTLLTYFLCRKSDQIKNDYFFTGLVDGTMILQSLLVIFFQG
ncbi:MAG: UbiA family prenyltransferase [Saprospiraceae bacterium]